MKVGYVRVSSMEQNTARQEVLTDYRRYAIYELTLQAKKCYHMYIRSATEYTVSPQIISYKNNRLVCRRGGYFCDL